MTNHHKLSRLSFLKNITGRLGGWTLALQVYNITVIFKSGSSYTDTDHLSRCPVQSPDYVDDEMNGVFDAIALMPPTTQDEQRQGNCVVDIVSHLEESPPS